MRKNSFYWSQMGVTLLCCAFLMIPVVQTILTAFMVNAFRGFSAGFTLEWFAKVLDTYGDTIFRSIYLAFATLLCCIVLGVPAAYALVKCGKSKWAAFFEEALVLPLSIPGMAIGLGILLTWGSISWFRHSWLFLLVGHVIFCLPFMVRSVTAVLRVVPMNDFEEAAATLGASEFRRFLGVIVPLAGPGILAGSLMVLTLSIGEFNISWMLQTPFTRTLPVGLADSYVSMRLEVGSAYTVIFLILIVPILILMQRVPLLLQSMTSRSTPSTTDNTMSTQQHISRTNKKPFDPVSIDLKNCSKTYGTNNVLKPFSLHIPAGNKLVLLGPSGCGKTTTLRIIAGLETPDKGGEIHIGTEDVTNIPVEQRHIGMMFQQYALFPHLTVAENVAYGLKVRGQDSKIQKATVQEMLDLVRLGSMGDRRIQSLSGGQKQRVALARALAIRPRILLLDEPLTALDALLRVSVREELDQVLTELGITTVIVTHDQEEAMSLGDTIVVMHGGHIVQVGSPQEIYHTPATPFVAGFVGGSNTLLGRMDAEYVYLPGGGRVSRQNLPQYAHLGQGDVMAFFRPEKARLIFDDSTPDVLRGTVLASHFLGDKTRVSILFNEANEEESIIKVDMLGQQQALAKGTRVGVNLTAESLMLFTM